MEKKPVLRYDVQEKRVSACPSLEFRQELNERSQRSLQEQHEKAAGEGKVVVLVQDHEQRRLVSSSMDLE